MKEADDTLEWREAQVAWMHAHHQELARQTEALNRISRHTGLLYAIALGWLILLGVGFFIAVVAAAMR